MTPSSIRHIIIFGLAGLLIAVSATAHEKSKTSPPRSTEDLQEELRLQQARVAELERLLAQQQTLLSQLREQMAKAPGGASLSPPEDTASVASAVGSQERELERLSGELEAVAQSVAESRVQIQQLSRAQDEQAKKVSLISGWTGSHPYIRSADGNFSMQFGGRLHLDWRAYTGTTTPPNSFFIRRARLEAEGQLFQHYEYKVQADFADTGSTLLRDGYINVNYTKAFQVQVGQFKAPFSQEELQTSKYIDFVERSSVNNLVPARTPGVMVHGELGGRTLEYSVGAFNGLGELRANSDSRPEGYLRLRLTPFRNGVFQNFSFGGAVANGRHRNERSFRGRTATRSVTFFEPVPVNGDITRANAEFWWRYKAFSLRGEYDWTDQDQEGLGLGGTNLPGVVGKGYLFQATYLLTGETKTDSGITPKSSFLASQRGPGAWELAFRYESLEMNDQVKPNRAEAYTFGVNWWLTQFVRYQSNFVLERFRDPARAATPGERNTFSYLTRLQVIF